MNLYSSLFFAAALSLVSSTPSFSMEETDPFSPHTMSTHQGRVSFVKRFIPQDSSEDYTNKVADCYRDILKNKKEILHDEGYGDFLGKQIPVTGQVIQDYGWNFPSIPRVQIHLLNFIAKAPHPVTMMDIGPGYGFDSLMALLTKNVKVLFAVENQKRQYDALKYTVTESIRQNVDASFPVSSFIPLHKNCLTLPSPFCPGAFNVLNANKVIHFFDEEETTKFATATSVLLPKGGILLLTCLTPTPGSEIETFMNSQKESNSPGYVFYRLQTEVLPDNTPGRSSVLEVRRPKTEEKSAYFLQKIYQDGDYAYAVTDRVMHYHTAETLKKIFEPAFKIVETMILTPEETYGTDHMISIVAERN